MITPQILSHLDKTQEGLEVTLIRFFRKFPEGSNDVYWLAALQFVIRLYY